jgi:hypothetical protein
MKREDDEKLWDLLGRGADPKISPFFARNVVRETRQSGGRWNLSEWLTVRRLVPAVSMVVALIAVVFLQVPAPVADSTAEVSTTVTAQDYEVMADLEDLLAAEDSNSLDDSILL